MTGKRLTVLPVLIGLTIFGGFAGLLVLSWLIPASEGLPGLTAFPSAVLGDAALLPIAGALLTAGCLGLRPGRRDFVVVLIAGMVGVAGVVVTQAAWLADDNPTLNWTLPEPHLFNVAGWWHLVYSAVIAGILSAIGTLSVWRLRRLARAGDSIVPTLLGGPGFAALLLCLIAYAALVVHDSSSGAQASRATLAAVAISCLVVAATVAGTLGRAAWSALRPLMLGILTAAALAFVTAVPVDLGNRDVSVGLAVSAFVAFGAAILPLLPRGVDDVPSPTPAKVGWLIVGTLSATVTLGAIWIELVRWEASDNRPATIGLMLLQVAALATILWTIGGRVRSEWRVVAALGLILWATGPIAWVVARVPVKGTDLIVSVLLTIIVAMILFPIVTRQFDIQMNLETRSRVRTTGELPLAVRTSAANTVAFLVSAFLATTLALVLRALELFGSVNYLDGNGWPQWRFWSLVIVAAAIVAAGATLRVLRTTRRRRRWCRRTAPWLAIVWSVALIATNHVPSFERRVDIVIAGVLTLTSLLCGWWAWNSYLDNVFLLRLRRVDGLGWLTVTAISISAVLSAYWAASEALVGDSQAWSTLPAILVALGVLAMQGVVTVVVGVLEAPRAPTITQYGLWYNLAQDSWVINLVHTFVVVLPVLVLIHLGPNPTTDVLLSTGALLLPILSLLACVFRWVVRNAKSHIDREVDARAGDAAAMRTTLDGETGVGSRLKLQFTAATAGLRAARGDRFLRVLAAHVRTQNTIGLLIMVPLLVGVVAIIQEKDSGIRVAHRDS